MAKGPQAYSVQAYDAIRFSFNGCFSSTALVKAACKDSFKAARKDRFKAARKDRLKAACKEALKVSWISVSWAQLHSLVAVREQRPRPIRSGFVRGLSGRVSWWGSRAETLHARLCQRRGLNAPPRFGPRPL